MSVNIDLIEATRGDYARILELNDGAVPHVNSIDADALAALHQQASTLTVAHDRTAGDIAGFLLVLPQGTAYASVNYRFFDSRYPRFAYVDRIVINPSYRRLGLGRRLYEHLFALASRDERVACEVNVKPANPGSLAFHESLGFTGVAEQDTEGGSKRVALLVRELGASPFSEAR